jgi:hypothetical protein
MNRKSTQAFIDESVGLFVKQFGVKRVRAALARASNGAVSATDGQPRRRLRKPDFQARPTVTSLLEQLRQEDEEKHGLLVGFYTQLKDRTVLPESQDIRHFVQLIGLKEISGKSRKDMIPPLMRFLLQQPKERLQIDIDTAANVSEQERQKGFSVLTDKLLGEESEKSARHVFR